MSNHNFPYKINVKNVIYRKFNPHADCTKTLPSFYKLQNVLQKLQLTSSQKMYIFTTDVPFIHKYLCDKILTHLTRFRSKRIFNCYCSYAKVPYLLTMLCILSSITTSLCYAIDIKFIILYFNQDIYFLTYIDLIFLIVFLHVLEKTHVLYTSKNTYVNIINCSSCPITKIAQMLLAFIYNCCMHTSQSLPMSIEMHEIHNFHLKQNNTNNAR